MLRGKAMAEDKPKRHTLVPEMKVRLDVNRHGRLMAGQWLDLTTGPALTLSMLVLAALVVFGGRGLALLAGRGWWLAVLLGIAAVLVPLVLRARRYARADVQFACLLGGTPAPFYRPQAFTDSEGRAVVFRQRLAPHTPLDEGREYLVYYLEDGEGKVLLSAAPADHPDAALWQPTETFRRRLGRHGS